MVIFTDAEKALDKTQDSGISQQSRWTSRKLPDQASDRNEGPGVDREPADAHPDRSRLPTSDDFPDGGREAWTVVVGYWCCAYLTWGALTSFGTFQEYLSQVRLPNESESNIAWVGSLQIFWLYAMGAVAGKLFDRGHCRALIFVGSVLYVLCSFLLELCDELWKLILCQGFGLGIAFGFLFLPAVSAIGHYFRKKRATAMGIGATGSSIGAITISSMLQNVLYNQGWADGTRALAAITTVLAIVANLTIKTRLPPRKGGPFFELRVFRDVNYTIFVVSMWMITLGLYTPMYFGPQYSEEKGVDAKLAGYVVAILGAGSIFGRTIPNVIADRTGVLNVLLAMIALSGILQFIWLACSSTASLIVFFILYGFATGAYVSSIPAAVAVLTPDMRDFGLRNGMLFFTTAPFGLAGPPISGALFRISADSAASFGGACVTFGAILLSLVWYREMQAKGTWKV